MEQAVAGGRREAILAAALGVFGERGYDGAGIKEIAAAAGISPALLYHYFPGKLELLAECVRAHGLLGEVPALLAELDCLPLEPALRRLAGRVLALLRERLPMVRIFVREASTQPEVARIWRELIAESCGALGTELERRQALGEVRAVPAEVVLRMLISPLVVGLISGAEPEDWLDDLARVMAGGLAAAPVEG